MAAPRSILGGPGTPGPGITSVGRPGEAHIARSLNRREADAIFDRWETEDPSTGGAMLNRIATDVKAGSERREPQQLLREYLQA